MTLLATIYASAPADEPIAATLELRRTSAPPRYLCVGYENIEATLETAEVVTFVGTAMGVAMPGDAGELEFAVDNVVGDAQAFVDGAISAGESVTMVYRLYRLADLSAPIDGPLALPVIGGAFEGASLQVKGVLHDLLNTGFPRQRYTAEFAPGVRYAG